MKKKYVFLIGVFALVLLATGCSTKKSLLSCTQEVSGTKIILDVGFTGNKIDNIALGYDVDISKYGDLMASALEKQDYCEVIKKSMTDYKDAFKNCKQETVDKHIKVNAKLEVNKVAKNAIQQLDTPQHGKKELEEQGYKCTIK